uniref:Peptidase M48 domain-containing protein n=1 Tax=Eucampia antarctica TaxID=49252 RepID=A0A7S2SLI4_9STRA|mmetsp:Transcript_9876/g.9560  ORF Transcript_9876/g.9560 Transcript_9876/m.9560 type:complete len:306 (+) Transcript_9876:86-1003(+)|eukprot:CAMPEP_0197825976 /NCGR_PEP_ID=MMETSP1437-20131217/3002_1 /TAXON_ID=49252 ORGANISM="Eucampia antarctica, Strain CCMP1452" /NCGR_SAMPLE_ID=MMETSP1437 /ASSEMBLY_ACC=CAM_ASM_001096 /LENGTH=305 /DNA_ID=CAMNT_0043426211 /DNA_START=20 /DNA_END=937 /DNA_ORIENTATION=-
MQKLVFFIVAVLLLVSFCHDANGFSGSTPTIPRVAFQNLQENEFRHPLDRDLTKLILATPGNKLADQVFRRAFPLLEQGARLDLLSSSVKVSAEQLPHLHESMVEACRVLDISSPPELFVQSNPQANAYTTASSKGEKAVIVITSALLDRCSDREMQAIIGHELGHMKCNHSFYLTVGGLASAPLRLLPFAGDSLADSLLEKWRLAAEYTCDRAAVLVAQDSEIVASAMLKLFAGTGKYGMNVEAFVAQSEEYDRLLRNSNPMVRASIENQQRTHPLPVRRIAELKRWSESEEYTKLLKNGVMIS